MSDQRDPRDRDRTKLEKYLTRRAQQTRSVGYATMIPTMMAAGPVLGFLLGNWLEGRYGHSPWFVVGGVILGSIASFRQVIRLLNRSTPKYSPKRDDKS